MYRWPDTRRILLKVLSPFGETTTTLQPGQVSKLADPGEDSPAAVVHIVLLPGTQDGLEKRPRAKVEVYAAGESVALDVADEISTYLVGRFHYVPDEEDLGLIDDVAVESTPAPVPYPDDVVSLVSATYRLTCRPL